MGSGPRFFVQGWIDHFDLGIHVNTCPHELSIYINFGFFGVYIGFGKGYDE